jgi:hypothetical protein
VQLPSRDARSRVPEHVGLLQLLGSDQGAKTSPDMVCIRRIAHHKEGSVLRNDFYKAVGGLEERSRPLRDVTQQRGIFPIMRKNTSTVLMQGVSQKVMSIEQVSYSKNCTNNHHRTVTLKYCIVNPKSFIVIRRNRYRPHVSNA